MSIPFEIIELDRTRKIRFGIGAMVEAEKMLGCKLTKLNEDSVGVEEIAKLLCIGLKWDDKDMTLQKAIQIVDDNADNLTDVISAVMLAINVAMTGKKIERKNLLLLVKPEETE